MNCISRIVRRLANQENIYGVPWIENVEIAHHFKEIVRDGRSANTPSVEDMCWIWHTGTMTANLYLETIASGTLESSFEWESDRMKENVGVLLLWNTYRD